MRSRTLASVAALAAALLPVGGCVGQGQAKESPKTFNLALLFDPTVLDAGDPAIDSILAALEAYLVQLPENASLTVWSVGSDIDSSPRLLHAKLYPLDRAQADEEAHSDRVKADVAALVGKLKQSWTEVHSDSKTLRSCILTALYGVGRHDFVEGDVSLLVVSDLLEACDNWKVPVNSELLVSSEEELPEDFLVKMLNGVSMDLSRIGEARVLRISNPRVRTAFQVETLERAWTRLFKHISLSPISFLDSLPENLALPGR